MGTKDQYLRARNCSLDRWDDGCVVCGIDCERLIILSISRKVTLKSYDAEEPKQQVKLNILSFSTTYIHDLMFIS